jgi:hypothetical protein
MRLGDLMRPGSLPLVVAALATISIPSAAQTSSGPSQNDPRPRAVASAKKGQIVIDGRIDESAWAEARPITEFLQRGPDEGKPATQRTEIRILFDESAIYVGARMYDSLGAAGVRTQLARRDQLLNDDASDNLEILFDPFRDRSTRLGFLLNPSSVKGDHTSGDATFDPVWEGTARIDSLGWTAEMRIPLSQLRFPRDPVQTWGLQIWRTVARRKEYALWAFFRQTESGGASAFGTLEELKLGEQRRQVEIMPYAVSRLHSQRVASGNPYRNTNDPSVRVGGDVKYILTPSLTLDATVNPDFGQVEVDPAVVNLSVFETSFAEKRPFFVANSSAYSFGSFSCYTCSNVSSLSVFYSRRIGRAPQLGVPGIAAFSDMPENSTILGAAKITGRTKNGYQIGLLEAVTNRAEARFHPVGDVGERTQEVEPLTNYFVGRLRKDLRKGDTRIGAVTTLVNRFSDDTLVLSRLRSRAAVGGVDIEHYWKQRRYRFSSQFAVSSVAGDTGAMRRTQQSSTHYFHRPDRELRSDGLFDVSWDPNRTSLQGYGWYARVAKEGGNWLWETTQNWRSAGWEVNDAAILSRTDYRYMLANVVRRWTTPGSWYRNIWTTAGAQTQYNFEGERTDLQYHGYGEVTFKNYLSAFVYGHRRPGSYDPLLLRGGPMGHNDGHDFINYGVNGDSRGRVTWGLSGEGWRAHDTDGWFAGFFPRLTIKPSARLLVSLQPSYWRSVSATQFVTSLSDPTAADFAGTRYVFGKLDQRNLSMNTRINATFTPTLTLEMFAQPFLASGGYSEFKEFSAPRARQFRVYGRDVGTISDTAGTNGVVRRYGVDPDGAGPAQAFAIDNPDFTLHSLRGTAVLRWEYRPGSTLFFVWTQQRAGQDPYRALEVSRDGGALFRDRPTNVFLIKGTFWLGL